MSKKSSVETNRNRWNLHQRYKVKRVALKEAIMKKGDTSEDFKNRLNAVMKLAKLPRNSSRNRYRLRCSLTGRARGNYRQFGVCRIAFRELASQGELPGITKSSW